MRRRSRASEPVKARRRKAASRKHTDAPKVMRGRSCSAPGQETEVVAFADFATLRALPRLPLRSSAGFFSFDPFVRLAMIAPWSVGVPMQDQKTTGQAPATCQTSYQQIAA
jgi:hypothetical protein